MVLLLVQPLVMWLLIIEVAEADSLQPECGFSCLVKATYTTTQDRLEPLQHVDKQLLSLPDL